MTGFEVVDAGLLTTIQDRGRSGYAHLGVPRSGALDQRAMAAANRLVGNGSGAAVLETTLTGCSLRMIGTQVIGVAGAFSAIMVDGRAVAWGSRLVVPDGAVVAIGPAQRGARSVIAIAGGIETGLTLGSRSTDTLGGLGPAPLQVGDVVPLGYAAEEPREGGLLFQDPLVEVGLLPGPHTSWCSPEDLARSWTVSAASNRIGVRLDGDSIVRRASEIRSYPMIMGAVQLPPSGQPIILLADHATTGGYPVVAVLAPEFLDACAQWRPGDRITTYWR